MSLNDDECNAIMARLSLFDTSSFRDGKPTFAHALIRAGHAARDGEVAELRKDAERYRFWRKFYDCRFALKLGANSLELQEAGYAKPVVALSLKPSRPQVEIADNYESLVDAAIDAALSRATEGA